MDVRLATSTAVTVREDCTVRLTVVGLNVEAEFGDRDHNLMVTFIGASLDRFVANATEAIAERDAAHCASPRSVET